MRHTLHIIHHVCSKNVQAVILGLDAQKAFDSVEWGFRQEVLSVFNFNDIFVKTIDALYQNLSARIKINGGLSESFKIERGCRQRCPISPQLFALFIEPLSQWIRQNEKIQGIKINQTEHKIAVFADDVLLSSSKPNDSLSQRHQIVSTYGTYSGYKINSSKSQVLSFNFTPSASCKSLFSINWEATKIKYLGITILKTISNQNSMVGENYRPLIKAIHSDTVKWNMVPFLGLAQRIESVKMNILPRLLYLFQSVPSELPASMFQEIDRIVSRFIWQGQRPRVKFKTLQLLKIREGFHCQTLRTIFKQPK